MAAERLLEYRAECSELRPREAILRLRWAVSPAMRDSRIEVTPYKNGFTTGRFVAVAADPKALPESGALLRAPANPTTPVSPPAKLELRLESLMVLKDGAQIEAVLTGFIPGVNYYVRVRGVSETVRVQAPICPVDYVDTPRESPK